MKSRYDKEKERYEKYKESISLLKTGDDISNLKFLLNLYGGSYKTMASLMTYIAAESLVKEKREIYGKSKEAYQKVLDNFNSLIEELNIDTSLGVALLNSHMVWDGYFSYNKENKYNDKDILNLPGLHGLDVFNEHKGEYHYYIKTDHHINVRGGELLYK